MEISPTGMVLKGTPNTTTTKYAAMQIDGKVVFYSMLLRIFVID